MPHNSADTKLMQHALNLARRGLGRTSPNPVVGAVVVKDGAIVGEGWHQRAGELHAEPLALNAAGSLAQEATIYVSLEPCCHTGRTGPCTDAIIQAGIKRVVYACGDCDDRCNGQGAAALIEAGIQVTAGVLEADALRLNEPYFKHKRTGHPWVTLKMACSMDGKTATSTGDSRWISCEQSRLQVHQMRNEHDAIMVGIGTVLTDDPQLTTRLPQEQESRNAQRIIIDTLARTPVTANVLSQDNNAKCIIVVTKVAPLARISALHHAGAEVIMVQGSATEVDLQSLMTELGQRNIMSILLEGGPTLAAGAISAGIVDRMVLYIAPRLISGETARPVLGGRGIEQMTEATGVTYESFSLVGDDLRIEARLCSQD